MPTMTYSDEQLKKDAQYRMKKWRRDNEGYTKWYDYVILAVVGSWFAWLIIRSIFTI